MIFWVIGLGRTGGGGLGNSIDLTQGFAVIPYHYRSGCMNSMYHVRASVMHKEGTIQWTGAGSLVKDWGTDSDLQIAQENIRLEEGHIQEVAEENRRLGKRIRHTAKLDKDFDSLMEMIIEGTYRLNEIIRALAINPHHSLDLTNSIQKLEKEVDAKYRELMPQIINKVESVKELIVIKDVLDSIENGFDQILRTTDSIAILALGL